MNFYIVETQETLIITVRKWNGENWGQDIFSDLEIEFPQKHERCAGGDEYICWLEEFDNLVEYWEAEIEKLSNESGEEYQLFVD